MKGQRFQWLLTSSLLICGLCSLAASAQKKPTKQEINQAKDLVAQGDQALRKKEFKDALDKYTQAIQLVPNSPEARYGKANAHYELKDYVNAKFEFQLALDQGYKPPVDVYAIRWHLFYDLKDYDAAIADLNKGIAIQPKNIDFLSGTGDIYVAKKQFKEALDAYQKSIALSPKSGDLYYNIASVQQLLGDTKAQREAADMAINNGTRMMGDAYFLLADAARKQKDYEAAIRAYQSSYSAKQDKYEAYKDLSDLYRSQGKFDDAIRVLNKARLAFRNDGNILNDLARYESLAGHPERAVDWAKEGVAAEPKQYVGYTNLCRAFNEVQKYQEAIQNCNAALRLKSGDGETNYYLGNAYLQLNKTAEADRYYRVAISGLVEYTNSKPEYAEGWYLLGGAYFANNQTDKAIGAFKTCLDISPDFAKARFNLGFMYKVKKDKASALQQYNLLVKNDAGLAAKLKAEIDKM